MNDLINEREHSCPLFFCQDDRARLVGIMFWRVAVKNKDAKIETLNYGSVRQLGRAVMIGLLTGLIVSIFRFCIQHILSWVIDCFAYFHHQPMMLFPWAIGSLIVALLLGWLSQKYPDIKGSGIPQVEGQLTGQFDEPWWPVLWRKFIGGVISIGSGLFLGREGPSIQLGATVGQGWSELHHQKGIERRVGIASGAAAGLSAAFNAPIASTMFILEEVYHNFSPLVWLSVFVSALCSNMVSLQFFSLKPDLGISYRQPLPLNQYWHLVLLGIVLGLLGRLYQYVILRLPTWSRKVKWFKPAWYPVIPFLLVIPIAWYFPLTLGGGNQLIVSIDQLPVSVKLFAGLFVLRFVFSMISYGSELPGGIFLPILTLGAIIGGLYAAVAAKWGLLPSRYMDNIIIYAMAGYFACISKAPFTAILLITEMVGSLAFLMPLAIVAVVAYLVVDSLGGAPVYMAMFRNFMKKRPIKPFIGFTQVTLAVFAGSYLDGLAVRNYQWPAGCLLTSIYRGDEHITPNGSTIIRAGDTLVVELTGKDQQDKQQQIAQAAHNPDHGQ